MLIKRIKLSIFLLGIFSFYTTFAQFTEQFSPDGFTKIEEGLSGFTANLDSGDRFSRDHDVIGDVNGDGVLDLVIGARSDDDGETDAGAVYILFMNTDGTVKSNQKISMLEGGFTDTLSEGSFFGYGVAGVGDYDGDSVPDIAVTANSVPTNSIYIIHLNTDGTVKSFVKNQNINTQGLSAIGDLNGDGKIDLVACNSGSNDGGTQRGSIEILFFNNNSRVITNDVVRISSTEGGFGDGLADGDRFGGREVAMLGDIDGDGNKELAVGAFMSDEGKGAVWILSLDATTYNVVSKQKITEGIGGFTDVLTTDANPNGTSGANLGHAMCAAGDLNGDGIPDLITGANQQDEGWLYILYLNEDKTVKTYNKINNSGGGFDLALEAEERFSRSISCIGDLRGDGSISLNVGGGAGGTGTLYILNFKPCGFDEEPGFNRWANGNILFSNWNHPSQSIVGDALSYEQCTFKVFETNAAVMTYNFDDGRCICMDDTATLVESTELSTAFTKNCEEETITTIDGPPIGATIWLRAVSSNLYVRNNIDNENVVEANANNESGARVSVVVEDAGDGFVALRSVVNDKYISADKSVSTNAPLIANRDILDRWEKFEWILNDDGTISLKANATGLYVSADIRLADNTPLVANRRAIGAWEKFTWGEFASEKSIDGVVVGYNDIILYPNPVLSTDTVNIESENEIQKVSIHSILGQKLSENTGSSQINVNGLSSGVYILKIHMSNGRVLVKRLVKK